MNVVLISSDPQKADVLKKELDQKAPLIEIEAILSPENAFAYLSTSSSCAALLLDTSVSSTDAANMVSAIRLTKKSMGIVALVEADASSPPTELIRAGVDKFLLSSAGELSQVEEALLKAMEKHRAEVAADTRQIRLLYAGDLQAMQSRLSGHPDWILKPLARAPDGTLKLPETESAQDEIVILDSAVSGVHTIETIKKFKLRTPDTPAILLSEPWDEEILVQSIRAGASDCIVKKEGYIQILLHAVEREIKRRRLIREKAAMQAREESLRQMIETLPAGIAVIAPDGTFLAVNHAGLKLLGAGRLDQIIGQSVVRLLPPEERDKIISFLATISQGTAASVQLDWRGLDGTASGADLRGVPMRRDAVGTVVALAVIAPLAGSPNDQRHPEENQEEIAELKNSLRESESRYTKLFEEHRTERTGWEQAREAYKEQCAKIENTVQTLKGAQETLLETHDAERGEWESKLYELDQKNRDVEARLTRMSEEFHAARAQWDVERQESEEKILAAEQRESMLNIALQEAQSTAVQLEETLSAERSRWDLAEQELEQKLQSAEDQSSTQAAALEEAQSTLVQLEETLSAERSQLDSARQEMEQKSQAAEKKHSEEMHNLMSNAESRIAGMMEENRIKSAQLEEVHQQIGLMKTEKEDLEAALSKEHLRYKRLSQVTRVGTVIATRDGRVQECNDAAAQLFGYAGAEEALNPPEGDEFKIYAFEGVLDTRLQQEGRLDNIEWSFLGRDGRLVRIQENARLVEAPEAESSLVERILTDITATHRLGEEIRRTRRLESTGDLAAATVRSLQSLCISLGDCGKLLMEMPEDAGVVRQAAETLLKNSSRGIKHSRQFLSIATKADRIPGFMDLNEIFSNNDRLLRNLAGENIDLQLHLSPRVSLVTADQQELIQLISSLVSGSREELPLGGTVIIETANVEMDPSATGHSSEARAGIYVQMTVSTDGCVVHPERRIAANRAIVERLGGWLETANNTESGNLHQIYLPRVEKFGARAKS